MKLLKFLILTLAFTILSCENQVPFSSSINKDPIESSSNDLTIKSSVKQISSSTISSVTSNSVTLKTSSTVKVGDIILCNGSSSQFPKGFLRKIVSVSGNTFQTQPALLSEAFSGSLSFSLSNSLQKATASYPFDKELCDGVSVQGDFNLIPALEGEINFPNRFNLTGTIHGEINLGMDVEKAVVYSNNILLGKYGTSFLAGPVLITPEVSISFEPNVNLQGTASFEVSDQFSLDVNVSKSGSWNHDETFSNNLATEELNVTLNGECVGKLILELKIYFYEFVGIGFELDPYARLSVNTSSIPPWKLYAGAEGAIGIETTLGIGSYSFNLFSTEKLIAQAEETKQNLPPTAIINISPSSGTTETAFQVSSLSSVDDKSKSELLCRWDFENNGWDTDWIPLGVIEHQYSSGEGWYVLVLEVKDAEGLTNIEKKSIHVQNETPEQTSMLVPSALARVGIWTFPDRTKQQFKNVEDTLEIAKDYRGAGGYEAEVFLKFPTPSVNPRKLVLRFTAYGTEESILEIKEISEFWSVSSITWESRPSTNQITTQSLTGSPTEYEIVISKFPENGLAFASKNDEKYLWILKNEIQLEITY